MSKNRQMTILRPWLFHINPYFERYLIDTFQQNIFLPRLMGLLFIDVRKLSLREPKVN